jgi:alpha-1,6-mannosyltransferase
MGLPLTAGPRELRLPALPTAVRVAAGATGMATVIAGTGLIALDASAGGSRLVDDGHHVPGAVLGPLAGLGGSFLYQPRFWFLLVAMTAGYVVLVSAGSLPAKGAVAGIVALHAIVLVGPPISSDVFSYLDYARLGALHGVNPYAHSPAFVPGDPAYAYVGRLWTHMPSAYGPLFTVASYPAALLGIAGGVVLLKGVTVASSLALVGLTAAVARRRGHDPVRAALLVGANPILIIFGVEAVHNDLPMLALAMLGVWLALRDHPASGAGAAVLGAAIKAPVALVLPFMLAASDRPRRTLGGAAAAALAVAAGAVAVFGTQAFGLVTVLSRQQKLVTQNSFASEVARLFGHTHVTAADRMLLHVLLGLAVAYLLVRVWRGADWLAGAGWALLVAALTTTWMLSWYTLWALPFGAVARDRRLIAAVLLLQALYLLHRAVPFVVSG